MNDQVVRRSRASSTLEITGFFDCDGYHLAACTHVPDAATASVVICPSLFTEALRNYRREVVLARSLAARGIAAQRFHYRGTGNSSDADAMTFEALCGDARFAAGLLQDATGATRHAYLGTRFGALVATDLAVQDPEAPLVLIEPVIEARRFFKEGLRAKVMSGFKSTSGASTVAALMAELQRTGVVDVLGDELEWSLYQSAEHLDLSTLAGPGGRPVLLVQLGSDQPIRPDYERVATAWRAAGCEVELASVGDRSAWWFLDERDPVGVGALRFQGLHATDDLLDLVLSWLTSQLGGAEP